VTITEPATLVTDWLVAALAVGCALRIAARERGLALRLWRAAFSLLAIAAFAGGAVHGFRPHLAAWALTVLWKVTVLSLGAAVSLLLAGGIVAVVRGRARAVLIGATLLQLAAYVPWMLFHDGYGWVLLETIVCLGGLGLLQVLAWRRREPGAAWIAAGVAVSFLAGLVQATGVGLHHHVNHNDLYHVIQMLGLLLLYHGGRAWRSLPAADVGSQREHAHLPATAPAAVPAPTNDSQQAR
jgi:hypothetical protein